MLLEVLDKNTKPIGVMKEKCIHHQRLLHKRILLLAYDKEKRLCLIKHKNSNNWGLTVNEHAPAFKAKEEVVTISFEKKFGISITPKLIINSYLDSLTQEFISIFFVTNLKPFIFIDYNIIDDVVFVTRQDFSSIIKKFPEFCDYYLKLCHNIGITFHGITT